LGDERSEQFTKEFFAERMEKLTPEEKRLYLIGVFCGVYVSFTKGQTRLAINGQKLAEQVYDQMSDEVFDKTGE
jgi:hypothetical protein